jgi:phosphate:Na+ symporter
MDLNLASLAAGLLGGLGLFLLGMTMMTDGLKLAAGPALERILAAATRTRLHALGSGALMTAVVQSSSAVTVAAIGFVNAGLMTLSPALWVLFGANVGTTMTGWIVALVGLKFKVEALALPLIGIGVLLRLTGVGERRGALGSAVAGLGLLFLGIAMLQAAFVGVAAAVELPTGRGLLGTVAQIAVGALLTVLMQSSSASMTVALTAAQGGLMTPEGAAAMVIGANIGTTVKAMLAAVGATPNARRAAAAHVIFNVLTGVVALALLPWLVGAIGAAREALGMAPDPATKLALFHTIFNLLGVLLMWPLAGRLTRWLQQRFRAAEEDEAQPRYLDDNVLAVPTLALDALQREVARLGHVANRAARAALAGADAALVAREQAVVSRLDEAAQRFVERLNRAAMPPRSARRVAATLRLQRYHETVAELAHQAALLRQAPAERAACAAEEAAFVQQAAALLTLCDPQPEAGTPAPPDAVERLVPAFEATYQALKAALLQAGADGRLRMTVMESALRRFSALRRAVEQATKADRQARHLRDGGSAEPAGATDEP